MKKLFLYLLLFVGLFVLCYILAEEYFDYKLKEEQGEKVILSDSLAIDIPSQEKYYVGIRNNHVVVYEADDEHLYEYTGIDASLIKELSPEIYDDLSHYIEFDSKYEMYRYLESLAS